MTAKNSIITKNLKRILAKKHYKQQVILFIIISYIAAYAIIVFSLQVNLPVNTVNSAAYKINETASEDVVVKRNNIYYIDRKATDERRLASARLVAPVFNMNKTKTEESLKNFESFYSIVKESIESKVSAEMIITNIQYELPQKARIIAKQDIAALLSFNDHYREILDYSAKFLTEILSEGIFQDIEILINEKRDLFASGVISLSKENSAPYKVPVEKIISEKLAAQWLVNRTANLGLSDTEKNLIVLFTGAFAEINCFYDERMTMIRQDKAKETVEPIIRRLAKGEVIVRKGDLITTEILDKIKAHGQSDVTLNINIFLQTGLYLLALFFIGIYLLRESLLKTRLKKNQIFFIISLELFYLVAAVLISRISWDYRWIPVAILIPTSAFAILITIIISENAGIVFSLLSSLILLIITDMNMNAFLFTFLTGIAGNVVAVKTEKRIDLIISGIVLSFTSFLILLLLGLINNFQPEELISMVTGGVFNGFVSGILTLGFLPVLEFILNTATRFRLMELSDLNASIFKKMLTLAPGTYNHSVFIANLAESVCYEIGANPLLARVGAYYHDIGKIDQAEYFIENQASSNKHDDLKPTLSAAIIKSHVRIGIEKGKELKLPREVIDIIAQHHGKGIIAFFYQRAISENKNGSINTSDFSYTTSRPQSKEAAVVMLADVVEAASRSMKKPAVAKLEKFIWNIIMEKFNAGELSESNLTLTDLEKIKNKFVQIMAGFFHSRIEYPKIKED